MECVRPLIYRWEPRDHEQKPKYPMDCGRLRRRLKKGMKKEKRGGRTCSDKRSGTIDINIVNTASVWRHFTTYLWDGHGFKCVREDIPKNKLAIKYK